MGKSKKSSRLNSPRLPNDIRTAMLASPLMADVSPREPRSRSPHTPHTPSPSPRPVTALEKTRSKSADGPKRPNGKKKRRSRSEPPRKCSLVDGLVSTGPCFEALSFTGTRYCEAAQLPLLSVRIQQTRIVFDEQQDVQEVPIMGVHRIFNKRFDRATPNPWRRYGALEKIHKYGGWIFLPDRCPPAKKEKKFYFVKAGTPCCAPPKHPTVTVRGNKCMAPASFFLHAKTTMEDCGCEAALTMHDAMFAKSHISGSTALSPESPESTDSSSCSTGSTDSSPTPDEDAPKVNAFQKLLSRLVLESPNRSRNAGMPTAKIIPRKSKERKP